MNMDIVRKEDKDLTIEEKQLSEKALTNVREEMRDNTYLDFVRLTLYYKNPLQDILLMSRCIALCIHKAIRNNDAY